MATIVSQVLLFLKGRKAAKVKIEHSPAHTCLPLWPSRLDSVFSFLSHYNAQCVYGLSPEMTFEKERETSKFFLYLLYWQASHPVHLSVQSPFSLIFEISFIWHEIKGLSRIDLGLGRKSKHWENYCLCFMQASSSLKTVRKGTISWTVLLKLSL